MLTPAKILCKRNPKRCHFSVTRGSAWRPNCNIDPALLPCICCHGNHTTFRHSFSNFLLCFWNISTFEKYFIGNISMLKGSVYSQKSIQNSFRNFTVETIQTIALLKYGYHHYANRLLPSWTAFPWGKISIFALTIIWVARSAFTYLYFIKTYFKCSSIVIVPVLTLLVSIKSANGCIFS